MRGQALQARPLEQMADEGASMRKVAIIVAVGLLHVAAAVAAPVPLQHFARKAEFESAQISPTGDYLAVAAPSGDQTALGIIDLKNRKLAASLRFTRGEHVANYWWVSPKRVVVAIANREGPLDQPRLTGELYAMDADGARKIYLFGYRGATQVGSHRRGAVKENAWGILEHPLPQDPEHALISVWPWHRAEMSYPMIERINVDNGVRTRVAVVPAYAPLRTAVDRSGQLRMVAGRDDKGDHQLLVPDDQVDGGWRLLAHPGGSPKTLTLHHASPGGDKVFLTSNDASGRDCLREYRVQTASFASRACSDASAFGEPVFSFDDEQLIGMRSETGVPRLSFFDERHPDAKLMKALLKTFGAQRVRVTSSTLDGRAVVVLVDAGSNPGDFFLVDRATHKAEYIMSKRAWIDPAAMAPVRAMSYRTRDGATIHGYLTVPRGKESQPMPLVVMPHGGPHGIRDWWEWDAWSQALASRGYAVLRVNYRGSGGYGAAHEEMGYRRWGTLMQDDLTDAVKWAVDTKVADAQRICIFGASYGGYAALMSATREPDLYRCAIAFAGVYDLVSQAEDSDTSDSLMGRLYLERALGDEALMREQSPVTHIAALKAPVLIAHGTADKRVPFSQAKILRKALKKHDKAYEWLEFGREEHGFYDDENHEHFLEKAIDFLDRHIGDRRPAAAAQPASP